jgi:hypothetical protein
MNKQKAITPDKASRALKHSVKLEINTMLIVEVLKVDVAKQRVDVQPVIKAMVKDSNGTRTINTVLGETIKVSDIILPPVKNVPICYARAGTAMITLPIKVGDTGMLIISQRDLSIWKEQGEFASQGLQSMFDINDGVYLPFVPNATNKISDYSIDCLEIRFGSDKISMKGDGKINITGELIVSGEVTGNGIKLSTHTHGAGSYTAGATAVSGASGVPS